MSTERIIGATAANRIRVELMRPAAEPGHASILVRTLNRDEVVELVRAVSSLTVTGCDTPVEIVISMSEERRRADDTLRPFASDHPLTYFRNRASRGLVLIELDPFSDVSGQRHLRTISDRELIGSSDDRQWRDELIRHAWAMCEPTDAVPPSVLTERLEALASAFIAKEVALRPWAAFVLRVLGAVRDNVVVSPADAEQLISDALPVLGLFRDPLLFTHRNLERELRNNRHIAQLRDPGGRELEQEEWLRRIEQADFSYESDEGDATLADARRSAARQYILVRSEPNRVAAPLYREWMRIFEAKSRRGLGEQVRAELTRIGGAPLERFEELEVAADLDVKDREAAQRLIDDDQDVGGGRSLVEIIPTGLRRRVERLAIPGTVRVEEPLRGILQAALSLASEDGVHLELRAADPQPPAGTRHVFALLFGPTLRAVAERSEGRLSLDQQLHHLGEMPPPPSSEDTTDADEAEQDPWSELRLELKTSDGDSAVNLAWSPRDVAAYGLIGRLIAARESVCFPLTVDSFETLLDLSWTPEATGEGAGGEPWAGIRRDFLLRCATDGFDADGLVAYAAAWKRRAFDLKQHVASRPETRERTISAFLDIDLVHVRDGREIWMLATHPLRLRWLARDLQELARNLDLALRGELELNPENSTLFFTWLERVSPHRQPPMLCSSDRNYLPAQELSLHEQYVRTEVHRRSVGEQMDAKTINEISGIVESYLSSFPSKVDRFVLLLLTHAGDVQLVEQLLKKVLLERKTLDGEQRIDLHLVAPLEHHRRLAAAASSVRTDATGDPLLPRLRTVMHAWPDNDFPALESLVNDVDIAIVPEVLGSSATLNDHTAPSRPAAAGFDPWLDKPVHIPVQARHQTDVTIELLPLEHDESLETWSTLNVRRRRTAVGNGPDDVDRVSLAVQVNRGLDLFRRLHDIAQWVVTVDEFVGREQIDAIPDPPDVILVRPRRGKNELYTLVVSSRAGREFVEAGLRRKLTAMELDLELAEMERLAKRLYDLARNTAPSVVLRAIGLGRTLEEILGLVTTRLLVEQALPARGGRGADWWISLDDHTEWFGGASKSRADLARIGLRADGTKTRLQVDVIESKFRQVDDADQAVRQVLRTTRILEAGLDVETERADSRFWREEIARAIDGVSRREVDALDLPGYSPVGDPSDELLDDLRADLRAGKYALTVNGLACAIAVGSQGELRRSTQLGVDVIHAPRKAAALMLRALARNEAPTTFPTLRPPEALGQAPASGSTGGAGPHAPPHVSSVETAHVQTEANDPDDAAASFAEIERSQPRGKLSTETLRARLQLVVDKLDELRVPVGAPDEDPFDEGPGFYLLRVVPGRGVRVQQIQQRADDLQLALGLEMEQALRSYQHRGAVVIEVPKADDDRYQVTAEALWRQVATDPQRLLVPVGEDISGEPVTLDFSSPNSPHLLVAGMTGSGKSVALESLLKGACRYDPADLQILAVDPKGTELRFLEGLPHLHGRLGRSPEDASSLLEEASIEMERRYAVMSAARVSNLEDYNTEHADSRMAWWLIVLDEYADLALDSDDRKKIEPKMLKLAQKARAAGIHLIVATQRPSADILNTSVRANFPAQLALRVRSAIESTIIIGESGAEALAGKGDALLRTSEGLTRVQCATTRL